MGLYVPDHYAAHVVPPGQEPKSKVPLSQDQMPIPMWRSQPLLLLVGAGGIYLAVGLALTLEMPFMQVFSGEMERFAGMPSKATVQSRIPMENAHGIEQLQVGEDIRSLMADDMAGPVVEVPNSEAAPMTVSGEVPVLEDAAAAVADPALDAISAPAPIPFQTIAELREIPLEATLPKLPALIKKFAGASPLFLAPPAAPDMARMPDVTPSLPPGFVWPAELELASPSSVLTVAHLHSAELTIAHGISGLPNATAGRSQPTAPVIWRLSDRRKRTEDVISVPWPMQKQDGSGRGCAAFDCLTSLPHALGVTSLPRHTETTPLHAKTSSIATAATLGNPETVDWGSNVATLSVGTGSAARAEPGGPEAMAGNGKQKQNNNRGASAGTRNGGISTGKGQGSKASGAPEATESGGGIDGTGIGDGAGKSSPGSGGDNSQGSNAGTASSGSAKAGGDKASSGQGRGQGGGAASGGKGNGGGDNSGGGGGSGKGGGSAGGKGDGGSGKGGGKGSGRAS